MKRNQQNQQAGIVIHSWRSNCQLKPLVRIQLAQVASIQLAPTVTEPTRVYRHQWQAGETLLWDNRALLHRAVPYDYLKPRVLLGTRVAGEPASELAYYPDDPAARAGRDVLAAELLLLRQETTGKRFHEATEESI